MERLLGFDPQLLFDSFITAVNIFILFFALSYLLFNPVRDMLEKRRLKIEGDLLEAASSREAALILKEDYENKLSHIKSEAESLLESARKKAEGRERQVLQEAREEAFCIVERGSREIELEKKRAMEEIKVQIVSIAYAMASKALSGKMNDGLQDMLINETLKEIGDATWQK